MAVVRRRALVLVLVLAEVAILATAPVARAADPTYPGGSAQYLVIQIARGDAVDVRVELPTGWTDPACDDALTTPAGASAPGWSCTIDRPASAPVSLHWARVVGTTTPATVFPFAAVAPTTAGPSTFAVRQTYADGSAATTQDTRTVGPPAHKGVWLAAADGGVFALGDARFHGSMGGTPLNRPVVGIAATPSGNGYWLVASDGGVFTFGDARFYGSTGNIALNKPIVAIASTPAGNGYWLIARDGGVFTFGDAPFLGSTGDQPPTAPVVAVAPTPTGRGYWLVDATGAVHRFGDAGSHGSPASTQLPRPVVSITSTPSGNGYWLVAGDGGIFTFGDAPFFGATSTPANAVGAALTPAAKGYWVATATGVVQYVGDATPLGPTGPLNRPIVGMAATR